MKKFFSIVCLSVVLLITFAFTPDPAVAIKTYNAKLGYTCENMQVAIDAVTGTYDGSVFNYNITYCSQAFTAKERYVKFTMMFVDKNGNIIKETSTGPVLNANSKLSDIHSAGVGLSEEPYDCIISWFYKDMTIPESAYTEVIQPDGTVAKERDDRKDSQWIICTIRSLKLYKNNK